MDEMMMFRRNAILADLCKEWNNKWAACHDDKEKLMRLVLMQQSAPFFADFCYRGKGLTKEYCLREFGEYLNGRVFNDVEGVNGYTYSMFVGNDDNVEINVDVVQFLWCNAYITVPQCKCPVIYVSNRSKVHLVCEGCNNVRVYLFDKSDITLEDVDENSSVTIYKYGDKAKVEIGKYCLSKKVKVFNKELKL